MTEPFTEANFLALIKSAEGTPYLYGGTDPFDGGADCSGLVMWAALQCGVTLPRTTEAEWADLPHYAWTSDADVPIGALVEFEVPGDGGSPPQHVGVNVGDGFMIDDPETGQVVSQQAIPNEPGVIWPIGWVQLPFVTPPPPPPPPIAEEDILYAFENSKGQTVIVGTVDGHTAVVTEGVDGKVVGGWSFADVTDAIEAAYPGTVVVVS